MAVTSDDKQRESSLSRKESLPSRGESAAPTAAERRLKVGANVLVAIVLVAAVVGVLQAIAYSLPTARVDMTSSRINSLSDGTINLLRTLDQNVTLTSLYFKTDLEEEDQQVYRRAVDDLLRLYDSTGRARVRSEWVNPLSDHEKMKELERRLRGKERFNKELEPYVAAIEKYQTELDGAMRTLMQQEAELIGGMTGPLAQANARAALGQIDAVLQRWMRELEAAREQVDALIGAASPQYAAAVNVLTTVYRDFSKTLKDITQYGRAQVQQGADLPAEAIDYLNGAGGRFATVVRDVEEQTTQLQSLEPLQVEDLLRKLAPNSNAIVVETDEDATVLDFQAVWPTLPDRQGRRASDRAFRGEATVTSAILRATHKEQTAAVFVRYGGPSLFMGGAMPGQPPAPLSQMKGQLEDANFIVREWDLKADEEMPEIEPEPTRTIFVVFKPNEPERDPMGRPSPEPPFSDAQREALLKAMGEAPRALFVAGWYPGPFGPIPGSYEYREYLSDTWGIQVDTRLLIQTVSRKPGEYGIARRDFYNMDELEVSDHPIVGGPVANLLSFPWCTPLTLADPGPEGVEYEELVIHPKRDGVWAIQNIMAYQEQLDTDGYMHLVEGDREGPFTLAVAAHKGEAKIVVVSSRDFAVDGVAFAQEMAVTSQGFTIRLRNPGNISLLTNSLHWLNDNTEIMDIGQAIDTSVLAVRNPSTVRAVQVFSIFVWPALALGLGGVAWWVRRR
jgi:hypothetical protein